MNDEQIHQFATDAQSVVAELLRCREREAYLRRWLDEVDAQLQRPAYWRGHSHNSPTDQARQIADELIRLETAQAQHTSDAAELDLLASTVTRQRSEIDTLRARIETLEREAAEIDEFHLGEDV